MLVSGTEHIPGSPKVSPEKICDYACCYDNNDRFEHKRFRQLKSVAAQYVPVIVYIVVVADVPAGCALIEYPSAAWGFAPPRTGAIGRGWRGHGAKKTAASTRHGNEQNPSAFARAIALSFAVFSKENGMDASYK